jgi:thermitase
MRRLILLTALVQLMFVIPNLEAKKKIKSGLWFNKKVEFVENELLVKFSLHAQKKDIDKLLKSMNLTVLRDFDKDNWGIVSSLDNKEELVILDELTSKDIVEYAEPNMVGKIGSGENEPYYDMQWYLKNIATNSPYGTDSADINAENAWQITHGSTDVIIAVLDSGIPILNDTLSHPELNDTNKIKLGSNFTQESGGVRDVLGHGTQVTGVIAANSNNNVGIAGIADGCKILVVKVADNSGSFIVSDLRDAIEYSALYGAKILNFSAGHLTQMYSVKTKLAEYNNILMIACAHNDRGAVRYPAAYSDSLENVMAVSATDLNDEFSESFSNYGPQICVSAPGGTKDYDDGEAPPNENDIYTTFPNYQNFANTQNYGFNWGTSLSTPIVSSIAGLMLSKNINLTPIQLRKTIEHTAKDLGPPGKDSAYGYGRVDAYHALLAVVGPQNFRITSPQNSYVSLAWDALQPATVVQHYEISRNINNWGWSVIATTTNTSYTDTEFEKMKDEADLAQYRIRSKTIDNVYSLYSNILSVDGISYWQQKASRPETDIIVAYSLQQNYPNPFNPATEISYAIPEASFVSMEIYNSIGQRIERFSQYQPSAGRYTIVWNASNRPSGTYFVKMQSGTYVSVKKMVLAK